MFFLLIFGLIAVKTPLEGVLGVRELVEALVEANLAWLGLTPNISQLEGLSTTCIHMVGNTSSSGKGAHLASVVPRVWLPGS